MVSLTPFGEDGPYANYQATDLVLDAIAGPMNLSGSPGTPPLSKPFNMVAAQVGNTMATAAMVALYSGRELVKQSG